MLITSRSSNVKAYICVLKTDFSNYMELFTFLIHKILLNKSALKRFSIMLVSFKTKLIKRALETEEAGGL